jgi:lipopolysaccharide/colanic/teichoic acid biosynthesis glycosyltransferase
LILKKWDDLPIKMKNDDVKKYYEILDGKQKGLLLKRIFDFVVAIIMFIILLPFFVVISIAIKIDSKGPVMFRQVRVTQYGKQFKIFKFRTMVNDAEKLGAQITTRNDARVTKVGNVLRKFKLDEIPQLFNIITGDMTFVGTRPEVPKYVEKYSEEMMATLLLPAGVTSEASIRYRDEEKMFKNVGDVDRTYTGKVLPEKMKYNLESIEKFNFFYDIGIICRTVVAAVREDETDKGQSGIKQEDEKIISG